jgi:hypothetical protein
MLAGPINDGDVSRVTLAADGLSLVFDSTRGDAGVDLWVATRGDASATFDKIALAGGDVDGTRDDSKPWLAAGGARLYFSRGTAGSVDTSVFVASRIGDGGFAIERELTELGRGADFPVLTEDELEIVYAQKGRILTARRTSIAAPFDPPVQTDELGTFSSPTWIAPDGCTIYMVALGAVSLDIFVGQR